MRFHFEPIIWGGAFQKTLSHAGLANSNVVWRTEWDVEQLHFVHHSCRIYPVKQRCVDEEGESGRENRMGIQLQRDGAAPENYSGMRNRYCPMPRRRNLKETALESMVRPDWHLKLGVVGAGRRVAKASLIKKEAPHSAPKKQCRTQNWTSFPKCDHHAVGWHATLSSSTSSRRARSRTALHAANPTHAHAHSLIRCTLILGPNEPCTSSR